MIPTLKDTLMNLKLAYPGRNALSLYFLAEMTIWVLCFALGVSYDREVVDLIDMDIKDTKIINILVASIHDVDKNYEDFRKGKKMFKNNTIGEFPNSCFNMADLGFSSGLNTLLTISNFINTVQVLCNEKNCKIPEFQAYLNDLPDNDVNIVLKSIPSFYQNHKEE